MSKPVLIMLVVSFVLALGQAKQQEEERRALENMNSPYAWLGLKP